MHYVIALFCLFFSFTSSANFTLDPSPNFESINGQYAGALCQVGENTQSYIEQFSDDHFAVHAGAELLPFSSIARVKKTLTKLCQLSPEQLTDNEFLKANFDFYRWVPDKKTADEIAIKSTNARKTEMLREIPEDKIFLTKYYTKLLSASSKKTKDMSHALYALPYDETGLSKEEADLNHAQLTRYKYTRQQVMAGALAHNNLAKPLVWLTEDALHDVLLQGTGVLNVDGKTRYFNVHRNNGIAYDYALGKTEQARYWYFAEVPSIMGYGQTIESKIPIKPHVSYAGNVKQLGLGQLILTSGSGFSRLGVLADQGGAFDNNLFQLDLLVDSYNDWKDYHQANKSLPDYMHAWILLIKE